MRTIPSRTRRAGARKIAVAVKPYWIVVDHRFALSMPALMSAPSKKSFSSANSPILAGSAASAVEAD